MPGLCYVSPEVVRNTPARVLLRSYTRVAAKLISIRRLHRVLPLVRNSTERLHAVLVLIRNDRVASPLVWHRPFADDISEPNRLVGAMGKTELSLRTIFRIQITFIGNARMMSLNRSNSASRISSLLAITGSICVTCPWRAKLPSHLNVSLLSAVLIKAVPKAHLADTKVFQARSALAASIFVMQRSC